MPIDSGNLALKGLDDLFSTEENRQEEQREQVQQIPMMKFVCKTTEPFGVKTIVSLNPIMVDGTGMCGGCRVTVGGKNQVRLCGRTGLRRTSGGL